MELVDWVSFGAAGLIGMAAGGVAMVVAGYGVGEAGIHWTERARRLYAVRVGGPLMMSVVAVPLGIMAELMHGAVWAPWGPGEMIAVGATGTAGVAVVAALVVRRVVWGKVGWRYWAMGMMGSGLMRFPNAMLMVGAMGAIVASGYDRQVVTMALVALVIGSAVVLCGGATAVVGRVLGAAWPALPRAERAALWAGERLGVEPAGVYEVECPRASITAVYPATRVVAVPTGAVELLSDQELLALLVWEMAPLARSRVASVIRLIDMVFVCGMVWFLVMERDAGAQAKLAFWGVAIVGLLAVRRMVRRVQLQSDAAAAEAGLAPREALLALERVHEWDLTPVVAASDSGAHPHLYDRMVKAGIEVGYPRPGKPSKARVVGAVVAGMGVGVVLAFGALVAWVAWVRG